MPRKLTLLFALTLFLSCSVVQADTLALKADHPERYTVKRGDTLWDISAKFLRDPWRWSEIWGNNPQIKNPHLIYPGDVVMLVYIDGKPALQIERKGRKLVKLSPEVRTISSGPAITPIPTDAIRQFMGQNRVISERELTTAGFLVHSRDGRRLVSTGDRVYARGLTPVIGNQLSIIRVGKPYKEPADGAILGYGITHVSDARMLSFGDPSPLDITHSYRETLIGDRVVKAIPPVKIKSFHPHSPENEINAVIIAAPDTISRVGQYQVIVLNKGQQDGLELGHTLAIYQKGGELRESISKEDDESYTLPDERAGIVLIFQTFDRVSYALVMEAHRDIRIGDSARKP